jgi:septum formation protein
MRPTGQGFTVVLASASPRRLALLRLTGWSVQVHAVEIDETPRSREGAPELAARLAAEKAQQAARDFDAQPLVLGADTVVADGRRLLGKPRDEAEAFQMLMDLQGRRHQVVTALALVDRGGLLRETCCTEVPMRALDAERALAYIQSGEPMDKAGAYGIQDREFNLVDSGAMRGCFANVMGFPICHFVRAMRRLGKRPSGDVPIACQGYTGYDCPVYPSILRGAS